MIVSKIGLIKSTSGPIGRVIIVSTVDRNVLIADGKIPGEEVMLGGDLGLLRTMPGRIMFLSDNHHAPER